MSLRGWWAGALSQNIAGFNFELTTANTDITFTDVTTGTTKAAHIFPFSFFGPDITTIASFDRTRRFR